MAYVHGSNRSLLPWPVDAHQRNEFVEDDGGLTSGMSLPASVPAPRKPKSITKTDAEWEAHFETIRNLYIVDAMPLGVVINVMEASYGFKAS